MQYNKYRSSRNSSTVRHAIQVYLQNKFLYKNSEMLMPDKCTRNSQPIYEGCHAKVNSQIEVIMTSSIAYLEMFSIALLSKIANRSSS